MNITRTNLSRPTAYQAPAKEASSSQQEQAPSESFSFSPVDVKSGLFFGALGFVPVVGAVSNFAAGMESGFNDNELGSTAGGVGVLANLGGTASLAGGLLFGNEIARNVGLGMLGVSGLTAAYAGFF